MIYLEILHRGVITVHSPPYIAVQKKETIAFLLVRNWNCLTQAAVSSSSSSVFKRKLQYVNFNGRGSAHCFY